jgi:hypothetical protein
VRSIDEAACTPLIDTRHAPTKRRRIADLANIGSFGSFTALLQSLAL